ncbi:MAG: CDP-alcohol phosphatidyltransferase family protein [Candidatus Zixiibacteriota bacterium]
MKFNPRELLLVPNLLTLFRLLFFPVPVIMIAQGHDNIALGLLALAIFTDVLDGTLARKLNQVSELGKILDPLADKLGIAALVVALVIYKDFPWWAAAIIIVRDLVLLIGGLTMLKTSDTVPTSNFLGKLTALMWVISIITYLTSYILAQKIALITALVMTPVSFALYLKQRR